MRLTRESRYNQSALLSHTAIWRCVSAAVVLLSLAFQPTPNVAFAAPFAYVTNAGAGTVSVVDAATNLVSISGIPVGSLPEQVAAKPDGTLVYVTNTGSGTVSVITTATNTVLTTIPVGAAPTGVAIARSNIASIPILSDPAIWLLIVAMSVGLTLRMIAKPIPSRRRTSRLI